MSWFKKIYESQSSQEAEVYYEKENTQNTKNDDQSKTTESNFEEVEIDDSQLTNATQAGGVARVA